MLLKVLEQLPLRTLDEIKADLARITNKQVKRLRKKEISLSQTSEQEIIQKIEMIDNKEEIIRTEKEQLENLVSAYNCILYTQRRFYDYKDCGVYMALSAGLIPVLLFAVDIVTLPVTALVSLCTGF